MTAPSTPDLAARILAAIDETERIARAATPGPWNHDPNGIAEWSVYGAAGWMVAMAKAYADGVAQMSNGAANRMHPPQRVDAVANAAHIARHDPASVLRRCEAEWNTLSLHRVEEPSDDRLKGFCAHCGWRFPCPDVRNLAAAYDITAETP